MSLIAALTLAAQAAGPWNVTPTAPSVGDTVVLWRAFPGATSARVRPVAGTPVVEPLTDPSVEPARGGVIVRYRVAFFAPGSHGLAMPDVDMLAPGGVSETVAGDTAWVTVASLLPPGDTLPPPRPSLGPLPRGERSLRPLVVLIGVVLSGAASWWTVRRRRGPRVVIAHTPAEPAPPPLDRWLAAGEARAVAVVAADRLRHAIAAAEPRAHRGLALDELLAVLGDTRPDWPLPAIADTLGALERARYAPAIPADLMSLVEQVDTLVPRRSMGS
ncbi:MAG TPA: hypothetical protein VNL18_11750 [Gemmatimonadales bacterium]|nr:hypothetical protein [Gemmatimonadales bacterium]